MCEPTCGHRSGNRGLLANVSFAPIPVTPEPLGNAGKRTFVRPVLILWLNAEIQPEDSLLRLQRSGRRLNDLTESAMAKLAPLQQVLINMRPTLIQP
jgi:hypothetical protein